MHVSTMISCRIHKNMIARHAGAQSISTVVPCQDDSYARLAKFCRESTRADTAVDKWKANWCRSSCSWHCSAFATKVYAYPLFSPSSPPLSFSLFHDSWTPFCAWAGKAEQCSLSDLAVTQTAVPSSRVEGYTKYTVTVENRCICTQGNIKLSCSGFTSSLGVNPDVLSVDGDGKFCTLNGGRPIGMGPDYAVKFSYVWSSEFSFKPVSSTIACSWAHSH